MRRRTRDRARGRRASLLALAVALALPVGLRAGRAAGTTPTPALFVPLEISAALPLPEDLLRSTLAARMIGTGRYVGALTGRTEATALQCVRSVNRDTTAAECWVRVGQGQGAEVMVTGRIRGEPQRCTLTLELSRLESRITERMHVARVSPCDEDGLLAELERGAAVLVGGAAPVVRPPPAPTPPPPAEDPPSQRANTEGASALPVGDSPSRGPLDALVTLVVFSEFQCPYCGRMADTLRAVQEAHPGELRVVFKHFPLRFHSRAPYAAQAAAAAGAQGKFWAMHDLLFAAPGRLDAQSIEERARDIGLDLGRFREELRSGRWKARVEMDQDLGRRLGVSGTPTTFINGRRFVGATPRAGVEAAFERARDEARRALERGVPRGRLYEHLSATVRPAEGD